MYRVKCNCPTPLAQNPFTCQAESAEEAKQLFFQANGISGTVHEVTIEKEVSEVVQPAPEPPAPEPIPEPAPTPLTEPVQAKSFKGKAVKNEPKQPGNDQG